jgi:predicted secreted protein
MRKKLISVSLLVMLVTMLSAGDLALFVNLGFSDDFKYFMFGQYGINAETQQPYAALYAVDVAKNDFVPQGVVEKSFPVIMEPTDTGGGALYSLLLENQALVKKYKINPLYTGRMVYILLNGEKPKTQLEFRDFNTGTQYAITLIQAGQTVGKEVSACFHLKVTLTPKTGAPITKTVGLPTYYRKSVKEYRIKYIFLAPDNKSLIFVIEKDQTDAKGQNIRYMIETLAISP